ncbi:acyl-CoA N-acyltransferase [Mytilinidion resinicola]|uniref:Acyl-CoA N-acyltransferase n=1 Tax=Mytilinidion resinicola TaxID=574789 RepID=A0A6A6YX53_9PEZI|nr:acyl-CoA N-acyltransferase [Mytilinidion resinicola]KAF2812584.1 acyl-CoA N-acyltransferase [Mytilinidion resinicola]
MSLELLEAVPADSEAIACLFALSWTSPFTRLQFGNVDTDELARSMAPRIADHMKKSAMKFIVMKDQESGEIASVAQWSVPVDDHPNEPEKETPEDEAERQELEDEAYRKKLPENSNKDLIMRFTLGTRKLREDALGERKRYLLENLATHPSYRGQGLASKLIEWSFIGADEKGIVVYLDTALDNKALQLYKKLGFKEVGSTTIEDLSIYGGEGSETHVALIRYPK